MTKMFCDMCGKEIPYAGQLFTNCYSVVIKTPLSICITKDEVCAKCVAKIKGLMKGNSNDIQNRA